MEMKNEWMWHEDFYEVYFWGEMNVDWHSMWLLGKNIKSSYKNMNMPMCEFEFEFECLNLKNVLNCEPEWALW